MPPAEHEAIVVARKPLNGTVANNVLTWGVGALNIDATRVGYQAGEVDFDRVQRQQHSEGSVEGAFGASALIGKEIATYKQEGRWPANTILTHHPACERAGTVEDTVPTFDLRGEDGPVRTHGKGLHGSNQTGQKSLTVPVWNCVEGCPVAEMDNQSGVSKSAGGRIGKKSMGSVTNVPAGQFEAGDPGYGDTGGASRYFTQTTYTEADWPVFLYYAKASKRERNAGLNGLPEQGNKFGNQKNGDDLGNGSVNDKFTTAPAANHHPTVKPVELMRHLVRLVTPPGGTVLDPFLGSGTTAVAAVLEGFDWLGCEMTDEYWPIIEARVAWAEGEAQRQAESSEQTLF